jgi:hypothetical protein
MQSSSEVTNPLPTRLAILLLVIGLLFALDTFLELSVVYKFWPVLVAMTGVGLIGIFLKGNARVPMFLAAGVYLVCFSGLALYCNFTSWGATAELWPLFVTFLGVVFVGLFCFQKRRRVYLLVGLLLVSLSVVFYLTLNLSGRLWWTIFILAGLSILAAEVSSKWGSRLSS